MGIFFQKFSGLHWPTNGKGHPENIIFWDYINKAIHFPQHMCTILSLSILFKLTRPRAYFLPHWNLLLLMDILIQIYFYRLANSISFLSYCLFRILICHMYHQTMFYINFLWPCISIVLLYMAGPHVKQPLADESDLPLQTFWHNTTVTIMRIDHPLPQFFCLLNGTQYHLL